MKILDHQLMEQHKPLLSGSGILVDAAAWNGELPDICEADDECAGGLRGGEWSEGRFAVIVKTCRTTA